MCAHILFARACPRATTPLMLRNVLSVTFFLLCVTHCVCTLPAGQPVCSGDFQAVAEMGSLQPETGFFRQLGILLDWVSGSSTSLLRHSDCALRVVASSLLKGNPSLLLPSSGSIFGMNQELFKVLMCWCLFCAFPILPFFVPEPQNID